MFGNQPPTISLKIDLMATAADLSAFHRLSSVPALVLAANGSTIIPSSSFFAPIEDLDAIVDGSTIALSSTVDGSGIALGRNTPSGIGDQCKGNMQGGEKRSRQRSNFLWCTGSSLPGIIIAAAPAMARA
jgi:hypothetical protein